MKAHVSVTRYCAIEKTIPVILFVLLGIMLFFAPMAFGSVQYWSQEGLFLLSVVMMACLVIYLVVDMRRHFVWTWAYVPITLFLGLILPDDELFQKLFDLHRCGKGGALRAVLEAVVVGDDVVAYLDTLVADEDGGSGDELPHIALVLVTEGTT